MDRVIEKIKLNQVKADAMLKPQVVKVFTAICETMQKEEEEHRCTRGCKLAGHARWAFRGIAAAAGGSTQEARTTNQTEAWEGVGQGHFVQCVKP